MEFSKESTIYLEKINKILSPQKKEGLKNIIIIMLYSIAILSLIYLLYEITRRYWYYDSIKLVIAIGILGGIRLFIRFLHIARVIIYKIILFPRLKREASTSFSNIKNLFVIVPTYMEKDWITYSVFKSIILESAKVLIHVTVVVCTNDPGDRKNIHDILEEFPLADNTDMHIINQTKTGKRNALADSLCFIRTIAKEPERSLIALMDGDAIWGKNLLLKTLPYFEVNPRLAGVTTNEEIISFGSDFYEHWFDFRLSIRDYYMSSHSFSKKILCLTGRFSVIRGDIGVRDDFIEIVGNDSMNHWLWGYVKFLGGDDKSTWFWIYKNGHLINKNEFMYIPDATAYTIECINENGVMRTLKNLKRWFTNTARNNTRSLLIPPFVRTPFFIWFCILSQRLTMFTNFIGVITAITLSIFVNIIFLPAFLYVFLLGSFFINIVISISRKRMLYHGIYIRFFDQFVGTVVKLWAFSHMAQQKWLHRGGQKMEVKGGSLSNLLRLTYGKYEFGIKIVLIVFLVMLVTGILNFNTLRLMWSR
jgi:glycosyltransferase Alg8